MSDILPQNLQNAAFDVAFDVDLLDLSEVVFPLPPSSNTGGNLVTPPQFQTPGAKSTQKSKLDYLAWTSKKGPTEMEVLISRFVLDLTVVVQGRGWQGYPFSALLLRKGEQVGLMAWGASHGRNYYSISGAGCKHWCDYSVELVRQVLIECDARLTRIDYALDFFHGEVTYDDCEAALLAGEFQMKKGGRKPSTDRHSSEGSYGNKGKTLYVGASGGSKRACLYQKGLEQLGKLPSKWLEQQTPESIVAHRIDGTVAVAGASSVSASVDWFRAEIRYGNVDRCLDGNDYEMLLKRDDYFAGSYPFCARVLGLTDGLRPETLLTETEADIEKGKLNLRNSYGSFIHSCLALGYTPADICAFGDSGSHSKRLIKAGYFNHLDNIVPF